MSEEDVLPSVLVCGAKPESSMSTSKHKQEALCTHLFCLQVHMAEMLAWSFDMTGINEWNCGFKKKNNQLRFHVSASCLALFSWY